MVSLSLTMQVKSPLLESRDRLYFDKYEYSFRAYLLEANLLRSWNHDEIERRAMLRKNSQSVWHRRWSASLQDLENLHNMCDKISSWTKDHKKVIYSHHLYLYSNDLVFLNELSQIPYLKWQEIAQAKIDRPRDAVILPNPKHKFRTYFRDRWLSQEQSFALKNFLLSRRDIFHFTATFADSLSRFRNQFHLGQHNFVDHDSEHELLLLNMVCPELIRKTLPIKAK